MAEGALSIERIVEVLVELDVVAFDELGPWPGPPGADDQVCDVNLDEVWPASDRKGSESLDEGWQGSISLDPWGNVGDRLRDVASRGPYRPPPILDALAWYLPIHFFGADSAIYLREGALLDVAGMILRFLPEPRRFDDDAIQGACRSAYTVLYLHEAFHHKAESFAIRSEVLERTARYVPYTRRVSTPLLRQGSDDVLEEALACAEMLNRLDEPTYKRGVPKDVRAASKKFVRWFIPTLGPSYQRGVEFFGTAFAPGLHVLQGQMQEAIEKPRRDPGEWEVAPNIFRGILTIKNLTRVVVPVGEEPLIPWFTPPFKGTISSRAALKVLTKHFDYVEKRGAGKGSHVRLESPTLPSQTVPPGREALSLKVVKDIAANLRLRPQDLVDLSRRV